VLRVRLIHGGVLAVAVVAAVMPVTSGAAVGLTPAAHTSARVAKALWRPDAAVRAIAVSRTRVFIAGDFTHVRNTTTGKKVRRERVAAFNRRTGALIRDFHPRVNGSVKALALLGRKLVLGGTFTSLNGRSRMNLAAVKAKAGRLSSWRAQVDGPVLTLLSMDGVVYAGGDFDNVKGVPRANLAALDGRAVLSPTWPDQATGTTNKTVFALAASADRSSVLVGGSFTILAGSPRTYLGQIARASGAVTGWSPAQVCVKCFVKSLIARKSRVYAGMAGPGGEAVAFRQDTGALIWRRHANGNVDAIAFAGNYLVIGGHFTTVAGRRHRMFAQLGARHGALTKRRPQTKGNPFPGVLALDVHDHRIRMGGDFANLAGQTRYGVLAERSSPT
jgi:outer membrane protein assembly factor BamB